MVALAEWTTPRRLHPLCAAKKISVVLPKSWESVINFFFYNLHLKKRRLNAFKRKRNNILMFIARPCLYLRFWFVPFCTVLAFSSPTHVLQIWCFDTMLQQNITNYSITLYIQKSFSYLKLRLVFFPYLPQTSSHENIMPLIWLSLEPFQRNDKESIE